LIERRGSFKKIGKLVLGVSPFVLFQGAIQIWSGHGFFETGQGFNIWKTMHGLDWSNPPAEFHLSLWQVIHFEPQKFVHTYGVLLLRQLYLLLPLSLFLMVAAVKRERFGSLTVLASATFLYILITLPGGSARAVTPVLPVIVLSVLVLFRRFIFGEAFAKSRNSVFIGLFTALVLIGVVGTFSGALRARHRIDAYGELQRATGLTKPENARGLYSDDYALYFPELRDATPRHSGGWAEIGLPNYLKTNPHISDSTSSAWYNALVQDHIAFAVLREPPIDHRVAEFVLSDTVHFLRVPFNGGFKVYRLK
jgi:hypothetical protein